MQPRFPLMRTLITALILALIAAAGVAVVARLTLPAGPGAAEDATAGTTVASVRTLADVAAAENDTTTASSPTDTTVAAGGDTLAAAAADSAVADSLLDATAPAVVERVQPAPPQRSMWPVSMEDVLTAPERWFVLAAFGLAFVAALATAAIAVRGSAPKVVEEGPVRRRSDAVQLLAVLQREGRLVDFLQEEISAYSDAQIGAAVRAVHAGCRKALTEHVVVEPVMAEEEGSTVTVDQGFDPSALRLTGNVTGDPPFTGALRHRGWRAASVTLPTDARGQDPDIVTPAEVEVS